MIDGTVTCSTYEYNVLRDAFIALDKESIMIIKRNGQAETYIYKGKDEIISDYINNIKELQAEISRLKVENYEHEQRIRKLLLEAEKFYNPWWKFWR